MWTVYARITVIRSQYTRTYICKSIVAPSHCSVFSTIPIRPYVIFYARSDLLLPRTVTERYVMYAGQHIRLVSRVSCIYTSHVRCMVNYSA